MSNVTNAPAAFGYDCDVLNRLPFQGTEVLVFASLFLALIVVWSVVYADVVFKQWAPATFLDPFVWTRVQQIQAAFPNLALPPADKARLYGDGGASDATADAPVPPSHYATLEDGTTVKYDEVRATEAYISTKTVDLDLLVVLANNSAFSTMSGYSAATSRGYAMLATMLSAAAFTTTLLCLHNFVVDPRAAAPGWMNVRWGAVALCFYPFILCTAIVMTSVGDTVYRQSNIMLWTSFPYKLNGAENPIRRLHVFGVVMFGLAPMLCHLSQALTWGKESMPNYATASALMLATVAGLATFGISNLFGTCWLPHTTKLQGKKVSILGEWVMMMSAFLAFTHWETFPTMYCTGQSATFEKLLLGAFFAPFVYVARGQLWAPNDYTTQPSLMLTYKGVPQAVAGPCAAEAWHGDEFVQSHNAPPAKPPQCVLPRAIFPTAP